MGSTGNLLNGNLSGIFPSDIYLITGDIGVENGDTLILLEGTQFLFDGEYDFTIRGVLKAQGTEQDSIIFDKYGEDPWGQLRLNSGSDGTVFEYVRISGASESGMYLWYASPTLKNVVISDNTNADGGGMYLYYSNAILTNVAINNNTSSNYGGGMYLSWSDPILTNTIIKENTSYQGSGMYLTWSDPALINVTVASNTADDDSGVLFLKWSDPSLTNTIIWNNMAESPWNVPLESLEIH